jgi:hypothetical protein
MLRPAHDSALREPEVERELTLADTSSPNQVTPALFSQFSLLRGDPGGKPMWGFTDDLAAGATSYGPAALTTVTAYIAQPSRGDKHIFWLDAQKPIDKDARHAYIGMRDARYLRQGDIQMPRCTQELLIDLEEDVLEDEQLAVEELMDKRSLSYPDTDCLVTSFLSMCFLSGTD